MSADLPHFVSSFVGRTAEIEAVAGLLADTRLLTLTGTGGAGKTRLAIEVARRAAPDYSDGVRLVELASLADGAFVANAVASALDIEEQRGRPPAEALAAVLKSRALLLVLDNCEHLPAACARLAESLLRACPRLRVLATSRSPLGVAGETLWRVPPLSLPRPEDTGTPSLLRSEAVQLFRERARAASPSFALTDQVGRAVADICVRLDGLPLAIELAAARVRALGVEEIAARLDERLLSTTGPTSPSRHRTLHAITDWSHELLAQPERVMFRRLAVFSGGWTLDAAEAVCAGSDLPAAEVLPALMGLVDKSLVQADTRGVRARFGLLETVRQYALERLTESGEERDRRRRHREWYLRQVEEAEPHLNGPDQAAWLDRLELEHDNIRAALEFSHGDPDGLEAELLLTGHLHWFWFLRHHWSEGRRHLERALSRAGDARTPALPRVLQGAMFFAWRQGDADRAVTLGTRGLKISRQQKDRATEALLLTRLAQTALLRGDHAAAAAMAEDALTLARRLGAKPLLSHALGNVGTVARHRGDYARAGKYYQEALAVAREAGDPFRIAWCLRSIGHVALRQGYHERAGAAYRESLALNRDRWVAGECLVGLARVQCTRRDYDRAARLLGIAEALRDPVGHRRLPADQTDFDRCAAIAREKLGNLRFEAAMADGRGRTLDDGVAFALAPGPVKTGTSRPGGLTVRELDVGGLIAGGLTNREIAARLGTAPRTIEVHVAHILEKLRAKSRAQIAAWAVQHDLHLRQTGEIQETPDGT
jgi:predicted ATPase/DNA-binding CsgD family transcriptional regulator/Tfp pilus assembly protein PilF